MPRTQRQQRPELHFLPAGNSDGSGLAEDRAALAADFERPGRDVTSKGRHEFWSAFLTNVAVQEQASRPRFS